MPIELIQDLVKKKKKKKRRERRAHFPPLGCEVKKIIIIKQKYASVVPQIEYFLLAERNHTESNEDIATIIIRPN